jgi:hypothetical protein
MIIWHLEEVVAGIASAATPPLANGQHCLTRVVRSGGGTSVVAEVGIARLFLDSGLQPHVRPLSIRQRSVMRAVERVDSCGTMDRFRSRNVYSDLALKIDQTVHILVEGKAASVKGLHDKDVEQVENYASRSGGCVALISLSCVCNQ